MSWAWWDWPLTWLTNHHPSVLWRCWLGHLTRKIVSKMTYNVSSGTLNSTILFYPAIGRNFRGCRKVISKTKRPKERWIDCVEAICSAESRHFNICWLHRHHHQVDHHHHHHHGHHHQERHLENCWIGTSQCDDRDWAGLDMSYVNVKLLGSKVVQHCSVFNVVVVFCHSHGQ